MTTVGCQSSDWIFPAVPTSSPKGERSLAETPKGVKAGIKADIKESGPFWVVAVSAEARKAKAEEKKKVATRLGYKDIFFGPT